MDQSQHFSRNVPAKLDTSMSLPYHVETVFFGGLLPAISTPVMVKTQAILSFI
jgi:hypothetical protein